jgi:hypothetical protein
MTYPVNYKNTSMKKNTFYKICFVCTFYFITISANSQTGICGTTHNNTEHTITLFNPAPAIVGTGIYNLTIRYVDPFSGVPIDPDGFNATLTSTVANVTTSNSSQLVITDNTLTFPTIAADFFEFLDTKGRIQFNNGSGNYFWYWDHDQITCMPLPVTLISFAGQLTNSNTIRLNWVTADEYNLSSYVVERSSLLPGHCFTSIGQVTPMNTSGNHTYQFIDNVPYYYDNFYRLKTVDIDGRFKYSNVIRVRCTACSATPPAVNCSQVSISGPSSVCTANIFSLTGVTSCGTAIWSISPSGIGTVVPNYFNSLNAKVTSTGSGTATISATLPGCPTTFTKTIILGTSPIITTTSTTKYQAYTQYLISVYNPTGASTSYSWYSNGTFVGNGYSKYYYIYPSSSIYYSVTQNSACGTSSAYGNLYYQAPPGGGGCGGIETIVQYASGSGKIDVYRVPPCDPIPVITNSSAKNITLPDDYELRLIDFQGTIKKQVNHVSLKNIYRFNVNGITPGNYIVQVVNQGVIVYSKKLRVE